MDIAQVRRGQQDEWKGPHQHQDQPLKSKLGRQNPFNWKMD